MDGQLQPFMHFWLHNNLTASKMAGRIKLRRFTIYAVIETGGKQYRVSPGQNIVVEKLPVAAGSPVELERVLLVADGDQISTGNPLIEGARVLATVVGEGRGKKILVFKYKSKVRYRRLRGHRQPFTKLAIQEIRLAGEPAGEVKAHGPQKRGRQLQKRKRQPVEKAGGEAV